MIDDNYCQGPAPRRKLADSCAVCLIQAAVPRHSNPSASATAPRPHDLHGGPAGKCRRCLRVIKG